MLDDAAGRPVLRSLELAQVEVEASCKLAAVVVAVPVAWTKAMVGRMVHSWNQTCVAMLSYAEAWVF